MRTSKPFISLLGETYELKTNKFRFIGECVCKVPSTLAFHAEGEGFEMTKNVQAKMKFTGTQVKVKDENLAELKLKLEDKDEIYYFPIPEMTIGNLLLPSRYMEPVGEIEVINATSDLENPG